MKSFVLVAFVGVAAALTGCSGHVGSAQLARSPPLQTMTVPGLTLIVPLRTQLDGTPFLTISPPAHWVSNWEAGEDTRRHYLRGDGVTMTIETWAYPPTWKCRSAACGLSSLMVDGVAAKLLRSEQPPRLNVFIPRRGDPTGRGVSIWATCASKEGCLVAEQAIATIRGF